MNILSVFQDATQAISELLSAPMGPPPSASSATQAGASAPGSEDSFGLDDIGNIFGSIMSGGFGKGANELLDAIGLPDVIGDIVGVAVDCATGNIAGAVINGLDVVEDVARACGGDEIAGYLKAGAQVGSQITGLINPVGIASAAGNLGSMGGVIQDAVQLGDTLIKGADALQGAMDAGQKFAQGDLIGGALSAFETLDMFHGIGDTLGISSDVLDATKNIVDQGQPIADFFNDALADGVLNLSDIKHIPVTDTLKKAGIDIQGYEPFAQGLVNFLGASFAPGEPSQAMDVFSKIVMETTTQGLENHFMEFIKDVFKESTRDIQLIEQLTTELQKSAKREPELQLRDLLATHMRL